MTQTAEFPAREPVSDILREAARLGLELPPERMPSSAAHLYEAINDSLIPHLNVREPHRRRITLDTTITPCAEHAGKRLVPTTVHRVNHVIAGCFALYDLQPWCVPHTLRIVALYCRGGFPVPSLKDLANQVRDEQNRGADDPSLARCHDLTHGAAANSSIQAEPQAASELPPNSGKETTVPSLPERPHHPRRPLPTRRYPCGQAGPSGTRQQEPHPPANARPFPHMPRARPSRGSSIHLYIARPRWGVRKCADLGWPPPFGRTTLHSQSTQHMGNSVPC